MDEGRRVSRNRERWSMRKQRKRKRGDMTLKALPWHTAMQSHRGEWYNQIPCKTMLTGTSSIAIAEARGKRAVSKILYE